jgi:sec-independent protein translocase protein TatA
MFGLGTTELVIILVIVMILFGAGKISGVGRSLGTAISEFKEAVKGKEDKDEEPLSSDKPEGNEAK